MLAWGEGEAGVVSCLLEQARACALCGSCAKVCDIMGAVAPRLPGELCRSLAAGSVDERLAWFVPRCSLCGRCRTACERGVDFPKAISLARGKMLQCGMLDAQKYRAMWVDCDWNAITLFRKSYGLDCHPFVRDGAKVLYMPGCSLLNEGFELTEPALHWLEGFFGQPAGLLPDCCGMPLAEMGQHARFAAYEEYFWNRVERMGAEELVVACPNCLGKLEQRGRARGVRVRMLYELMAQAGVAAQADFTGFSSVAVHDSCPARGTQAASWVRSILRSYELREMAHCCDDSLCCGSGGAVALYDFSLHDIRAERRRSEFADTGADACVCYCMSSCSTLQFSEGAGRVVHLLEMVFGMPVDHQAYRRRVQALWEGDLGMRNARLLEESRSIVRGRGMLDEFSE